MSTKEQPENALETAEQFLKRVSKDSGAIVCSNDVTTEGIAAARAENRFFVDENHCGYVWIPIKRTWR